MPTAFSAVISDGPTPATKVVTLTGELDESVVETMKAQMDPILNDANVTAVILHAKDLSFINSKGIGYIVSIHTHLAKDQRKLFFVEAQQAVMDVVSLVGLTTIIPYFATLDEAYQGLTA